MSPRKCMKGAGIAGQEDRGCSVLMSCAGGWAACRRKRNWLMLQPPLLAPPWQPLPPYFPPPWPSFRGCRQRRPPVCASLPSLCQLPCPRQQHQQLRLPWGPPPRSSRPPLWLPLCCLPFLQLLAWPPPASSLPPSPSPGTQHPSSPPRQPPQPARCWAWSVWRAFWLDLRNK
uniref:Putative secreted protein n=1 Tax=Amblyomma aureolatum TaxID=187763 RepID=A0A1E1X2B9_9ACAR